MNTITYNTKKLISIEKDGSTKTQTKFKSLESLMDDYNLMLEFNKENPQITAELIIKN